MDDEKKEISDMIRNGTYFTQARSWYQAMYIGPIAERTFFLLVALLSIVIALFSIVSVDSLLPLISRPALLVQSGARMDDVIPRIERFKKPPYSLSANMRRFYVSQFVKSYEGYSAATYESNAAFIHAQATGAVYNTFSAGYSAANPASYAATMGTVGLRNIEIISVQMNTDTNPLQARVKFSAEKVGGESEPAEGESDQKTSWTAQMQFTYSDLKSEMVKNPETGKKELKVTDPQFQVVSYEVTQDKPDQQ